jgi:hypothetical protein
VQEKTLGLHGQQLHQQELADFMLAVAAALYFIPAAHKAQVVQAVVALEHKALLELMELQTPAQAAVETVAAVLLAAQVVQELLL